MARYRFHCTNGLECVLDPQGADIRDLSRLPTRAHRVAAEVMRTLPDESDWSEWRVTVHDLKGRRVLLLPFVTGTDGPLALAA